MNEDRRKAFKQYDLNKQRALCIATKFIPKDSMKLYYSELCNGCKCNNDKQEYLECCYCQDGSYYEEEQTVHIKLSNNSTISFEPNTRGLRSKIKGIDVL